MKFKLLVGLSAAAFASTGAFAQEADTAAAGGFFTGIRAEGRVGLDVVTLSASDEEESLSGDFEGPNFGAEVGFDGQFGGFVAGVYGGAELSQAKECDEVFGEDEGCVKGDRSFTVGGRLGFVAADQLLFYAKGGYTNTRFKVTYEDFEDILDDEDVAGSNDGYHVGGGVEYAFNPNIYSRIEYVYTDYKDARDGTARAGVTRDQFMFGLGFRF